MIIDLEKIDIRKMSRDELTDFVKNNDEIEYGGFGAEISNTWGDGFDKYTTLMTNQESDNGYPPAKQSSNVFITEEDIRYLTDYENNKELIDGKTGVRDLKLGSFKAWLDTYSIRIEKDEQIIYLPILKYYIGEDKDKTHGEHYGKRYPLISELFAQAQIKIANAKELFDILKQIDAELSHTKKKGNIKFQELSDDDKKEWHRIIDKNINQEYKKLESAFRGDPNDELPISIYRINGDKKEPLLKKELTINAWFAVNGLRRINYVGGVLYIDGEKVDKAKYYEKYLA